MLFVGHLVHERYQSSIVKSYLSAIRAVLKDDRVKLDEDLYLINSLTKACKLENDQVRTKFPIKRSMLSVLLNKVEKLYLNMNQPYLVSLYKTIILTAYFGLFRIGELAEGSHTVLAKNVQIGTNKKKFMFVLVTSKTHGKNVAPQIVKIKSKTNNLVNDRKYNKLEFSLPCPYSTLNTYLQLCRPYKTDDEKFFVFPDGSSVKPMHVSKCLRLAINLMNLNPNLYSFHGLCSGRACDLLKLGISVESIKKLGRWRSNAYINT